MAELLAPNCKDIPKVYEAEFAQMAEVDIPMEELEQTRKQLIAIINNEMTANEWKFLLLIFAFYKSFFKKKSGSSALQIFGKFL